MGHCVSKTQAVDGDIECINKVIAKKNLPALAVSQDMCFGASNKAISTNQDSPTITTTAAAEPGTVLPRATTLTTDAASAALFRHPAGLPHLPEDTDEVVETDYNPNFTAGNHTHDSASSTPRVSMDYSSRRIAAYHDSSASDLDRHLVPTACATITIMPAHKTQVPTGAAAEMGRRLREEQSAKSAAEHALGVCALVASHLACQVSEEQDLRRAAEGAARSKDAALTVAEQLADDLEQELSTEQRAHAAVTSFLRAKLAAAEQRAADLARQLITEQRAHAAETSFLRARLAAAEQQAADLACQVSSEVEARVAAEHAQAAAAAEADSLRWDAAAVRLRIVELERALSAEQASRCSGDELLQATRQLALLMEQRVSQLETALQATQQQAADAIANAQAKCLAYSRPPEFPMEAIVGPARPLGDGTFGVVHAQALDLAFKKASPVGDYAENQRCLEEEAQLMSECRHENILQLVAAFRDERGGLAAIAMPRGHHDLFDELQWRGGATGCYALEARRLKEIGLGLTSAIRYLHNCARIVHHDIKLGNIIVMANGVPKVADFGLGRRLQESGSHWQQFSAALGEARGTPSESIHPYSVLGRWMPGPHDDVWALCMLLQICVSGHALPQNQRRDLDRRLRSDPAGLAEVDAVCSRFGFREPTMDHRLAALQLIWPLQIRAKEPGMENLVQLLQLVLSPGLDGTYLPPVDVLNALHNTLSQIADYPAPLAPEPVRICAAAPNAGAAPVVTKAHGIALDIVGQIMVPQQAGAADAAALAGLHLARQPQAEPLQPFHFATGVHQDSQQQAAAAAAQHQALDAEDSRVRLVAMALAEECLSGSFS